MIQIKDWIAIIPEQERRIAYVGENASESRQFRLTGSDLDKYAYYLDLAFDLSTVTTTAKRQKETTSQNVQETVGTNQSQSVSTKTTENAVLSETTVDCDAKTDVVPLSMLRDAEGVTLTWTILAQHTQLPGALQATLRAVSSDGCVKKSATMTFEVEPAVIATAAKPPVLSEAEQIIQNMENQYSKYVEKATECEEQIEYLTSSATSQCRSNLNESYAYMLDAANAATAAAGSKTAAQEARTAAESAADTATAKATAAAGSATAANNSATSAAASTAAAESSAENAAASATDSATSATAATAAQSAAEEAAANATDACNGAQIFAATAADSKTAAENAATAAAGSKTAAQEAQTAAESAADTATAKATAAAASAASAIGTVQAVQESVIGLVPLLINNAGAHNATYRGKNLGTSVTAEQWAAIANGTFADLYIGDYWVIGGVNWRIAAFDYYYKTGDTSCTTHHAVIVPDTTLYTHVMNDTNTTDGGYVGSRMYTEGLTQAKTTISDAFGANHILTHRQALVNAVTNGKPIGGGWRDSTVELMSEQNVYGGKIFVVGNDGSSVPYLYTVDKSQFPLFAHDPSMISNRQWFWLRDVVSAANFTCVNDYGAANSYVASKAVGVRPAFAIMA